MKLMMNCRYFRHDNVVLNRARLWCRCWGESEIRLKELCVIDIRGKLAVEVHVVDAWLSNWDRYPFADNEGPPEPPTSFSLDQCLAQVGLL
jgi:hypothetical protein